MELVLRLSEYRGPGRAYYQCAKGVVSALRKVKLTERKRDWKASRNKLHRGVSRNLWRDRTLLLGLHCDNIRPLRAVSRRLFGVGCKDLRFVA